MKKIIGTRQEVEDLKEVLIEKGLVTEEEIKQKKADRLKKENKK